jgi:hypothetical protein
MRRQDEGTHGGARVLNKKFCSIKSRVNATGLSINASGIIRLDAEEGFLNGFVRVSD